MAPPSTRPSATAQPADRIRLAVRTMTATTPTATIVRITVKPAPSENAAPELRT